jgi:hypothetical protein
MQTYVAIGLALDLADDAKGSMAYKNVSVADAAVKGLAHQSSPGRRISRLRA